MGDANPPPSSVPHGKKTIVRVAGTVKLPALPQGCFPYDKLRKLATTAETDLKKRVYAGHCNQAAKYGKIRTFSDGVAYGRLSCFEGKESALVKDDEGIGRLSKHGGGKFLRTDVVESFKKLLQDARAACKAAKHDSTRYVQVAVGYRDALYDLHLWEESFDGFYKANKASLHTGPNGQFDEKAVKTLVKAISPFKAAPGFSNHTQGIAVDFLTVDDKGTLKISHKQEKRWEQSWLYKWLHDHKSETGWDRIPTEAWHWECVKARGKAA
jgi:hypothetical protein